jgi:xylitol oxidase
MDELRRIVSEAPRIHALGSRHSFSDVGDAAELVSLDHLDQRIEIDKQTRTVTASGACRYGALAQALERERLALHNMASLPHISVGGAIATATHGSGDKIGNLATAVIGLEMVTSDGDVLHVTRADEDFAGMVVGVGALGIVTRVTLQAEPTYQMRQQVFEDLDWDVALERLDEVMASATSVSLFTAYGDTINQVWLKQRVSSTDDAPPPTSFHGAQGATQPRHPIAELNAESCTEQLGVHGAWLDRLPHFRMEFTPSNGAEIQSEYILPRRHAVPAIQAIRELAHDIRPHLWIAEIRTVAADDLWLSTAYHEDSVCLHFTWKPDPAGVESVLPDTEAALAPFAARPHWGKLFCATASDLESRYERLPDFRRLAERLDRRRAFRNDFLHRHVFG